MTDNLETRRAHREVPPSRYAPTLLRLGLGAVFIAHALLKLVVFGLPGTARFFEAHGYPGWTAYPVFAAELIGGGMLVAGLFTRVVAVGLVPVMLGALLVHWPNGWSFTAEGGGWEYVAFLIVALATQGLLGDGAYAATPLLQRARAGAPQDPAAAVPPAVESLGARAGADRPLPAHRPGVAVKVPRTRSRRSS